MSDAQRPDADGLPAPTPGAPGPDDLVAPARADERARTVTRLLAEAEERPHRAETLLPVLYDELRALARSHVAREAAGHSLVATALVHEAYMRLVGESDPGWNGRGHFFGAAARAMRRILVEQARRRGRLKRGGGAVRHDIEDVQPAIETPIEDVLAVDEAVQKLAESDERKARLVELRWFAGLNAEETAKALGVSLGTVERDWRFTKAWLAEQLDGRRKGE